MLLLTACVPRAVAPPGPPQPPPIPYNAVSAGVRPGPNLASLKPDPNGLERALQTFKISCPALISRTDVSGLTKADDWRPVCTAARSWRNSASLFFATYFESAEIGGGAAFATGYYEPQIAASRVKAPGYAVPIYGKPVDLLEANPLTGEKGRGRLDETGAFVLYYDRTAIEEGALDGQAPIIAWAADPVDLFFLQIQGSGQLLLPDGAVIRIGYAGQNGREYVAIGKVMRERGLLEAGATSMQHIVAWLRANPEEGREIMRQNKSYIFFRELAGPLPGSESGSGSGPQGALGLSVTPRASVAIDPAFVPLGAPVFLALDRSEASGLWIAQDRGGAIKGANRFDTFWGAGDEAARIAGGMQARGKAYILLPKGIIGHFIH